jgi:hypothetical protein
MAGARHRTPRGSRKTEIGNSQALSDLPSARYSRSLVLAPLTSSVVPLLLRRQPPLFVAAPSRGQQFDRTEFWQPVDPHVHDRSWREVVAVKIESMKRTAKDIFKDALALPAEARSALASRLRESVDRQSEASRRQFVRARRRALKRLRDGLDLEWVPAASRDELHRR